MYDLNLTGQVAVNLKQNFWMVLSAGVIGGIITGFFTICAVTITQKRAAEREEKNQKYELKRQVYFEYIDETVRGRRILEKPDNNDELEKWKPGFDAARIKAQIVASDKIKDVFESWEYASFSNDLNEFTKYTNKTIDAIRADLIQTNEKRDCLGTVE
jgi:hypothetical protein